ncbi:uncharacterized protein LOC105183883 isoform X2 [Harpegnathos saltator]|uniref:uncharacterized protein LOC105183883 isoform X2 n=1 Tax=Harpegnathos saltator TaxID=610380 RepID=UPI00058B276E|nr:uncharacterized protein LOC105183883 isoform X2 [Harpegnathos saltator]
MARLSTYYTLCPLINQQDLLGVEQDKESGRAIVTLGRHMVIRYKDLKQFSSWSSEEKLTSQVIYDKSNQRYAAVFKEKKIKVWSEEEADLNEVKGYKFHLALHTILTHDELPPVLVQQNGAAASLSWAIANRKSWASEGILKDKEKLSHCQLIHLNKKTSLCCLTRIEDTYNCLVVKLTKNTCLEKVDTIKRIKLKRELEDLVGHTVIESTNNAYLLTLWSHGRLFSHFLSGKSSGPENSTLISVITNINTKHPVMMTHLNETTIAIYGADVTDEGAVLMIYNVQYKLTQAVLKLKLYTNDAKLWKVEDKLFLAANRHLAIAPYNLAPQRIAAMLGSSVSCKNSVNDNDADIIVVQETTVAQWDKSRTCEKSKSLGRVPSKISKQISMYLNEGWSNSAIFEAVLPPLIESGDISSICWCLNTFKDLPEKLLVDLLAFSLKCPDKVLVPPQNGVIDGASIPPASYLCSRNSFQDKVFSLDYCSASILPYLNANLDFDEVIKLLEYVTNKLDDKTDSLDENPQPSERQLYEWCNVLLDSHQQQYFLSQDGHVLELFNRLSKIVREHAQFLQNLEDLRSILGRMMHGKALRSSTKKNNKFYATDTIKFH